jgi:hypothetical protein
MRVHVITKLLLLVAVFGLTDLLVGLWNIGAFLTSASGRELMAGPGAVTGALDIIYQTVGFHGYVPVLFAIAISVEFLRRCWLRLEAANLADLKASEKVHG